MNPDIISQPFTLEEDVFILEKNIEIGNKWSKIIKEMKGRTENNVKNRFNILYSTSRREYLRKFNGGNLKEASNQKRLDDKTLIANLIE